MGYEIKLHIVVPMSDRETKISKVSGTNFYTFSYESFEDKDYGFLSDGTKVFLEPTAKFLKYAQEICRVEIGKANNTNLYQLKESSGEAEHYIFKEDGNTPLITDQYGEIIKESKAIDVIEALEQDIQRKENYRLNIASHLLKNCLEYHEDVRVLFFGH